MNIQGKNAIVTGGSRGIGRAICLKLAEHKANVYIVDVNMELANETAELVKSKGVESQAFKVDVSNSAEVDQFVDDLSEKVEHIDILVSNAGITRDNLMLRMTDEEWDLVLRINLTGIFNFNRAVAKVMFRQRSGAIVNVSSISGLRGNYGQANYAASKGGVIALTKSAAKELASRNIRVNAVAPGFIDTDMTKVLPQKVREKVLAEVPLKRYGLPEDIANVALFLASDMAQYITGQVIQVDGGLAI